MIPIPLRVRDGSIHEITWVDDADFARPEISGKTWRVLSGYARRQERVDGKRVTIYLHREILGLPHGAGDEVQVDHIDHSTLDNRRCNLRAVTNSENQQNIGLRTNNTSGLRGVSWYKRYKKWQTQIKLSGRNYNLGYFDDKQTAYDAYLQAAAKLHTHNPLVDTDA